MNDSYVTKDQRQSQVLMGGSTPSTPAPPTPQTKVNHNMQVIFDVDGTLLNIEHRLHFIKKSPKDWKAFRDPVQKRWDEPILPVIDLFNALWYGGHTVILASGRTKDEEMDTRKTLERWIPYILETDETGTDYQVPGFFRSISDYREDTIIKREMLDDMKLFGWKPTLVFDDRPSVIKMWREAGLTVADIGYGKEF